MLNPSGQITFNETRKKTYEFEEDQTDKQKDLKKQAHEEMVKEVAKEEELAEQKLNHLLEGSDHILIKISTVFPFHLFPKDISVDINKVNFLNRIFFSSGEMHSIQLKNISDVIIQAGLFFAKLSIYDRFFKDDPIEIDYLKKEEAMKLRRVIQGLMIAIEEDVFLSKLEPEEILQKVEQLGKMHGSV